MRDEIKTFIEKVSSYNAEVLGVKEPSIKYVGETLMETVTTKAEASSEGDEIRINKDCEWEGGAWKQKVFCIVSHEVRHCWQMQTQYNSKAIEEYIDPSKTDINKYNEQELEVDAWAWAWFMLKVNYGADLLLEKDVFSEKSIKKISQRREEIEEEYRNK